MRAELRDILVAHGKLVKPITLVGDEDSLFAAGLDSLAVVNVMVAIEQRFGIEFPDESLTPQSFSSIAALERIIHSARP